MKSYLLIFLFGLTSFLFAQKAHPIPKKNSSSLFYTQHNQNHNTFIYELNLTNGKLDLNDPIKVFRINYEDAQQQENLSIIQRKYAYGINYLTADKTKFYLSASKNIPMQLKSANNKYWVEVLVNNKTIILDNIFIQTSNKGKGLSTKVEYIILKGKDSKGNSIQEKFLP